MQADLFANGPYETPIVASEFETNQISANDVNAFLDRWYAPNNAVLIVSGDLDVQSLHQQVKDRFDQIAPRESAEEEAAQAKTALTLLTSPWNSLRLRRLSGRGPILLPALPQPTIAKSSRFKFSQPYLPTVTKGGFTRNSSTSFAWRTRSLRSMSLTR